MAENLYNMTKSIDNYDVFWNLQFVFKIRNRWDWINLKKKYFNLVLKTKKTKTK